MNKAFFAKLQEALKTNNPYSPEGLEIAQMHAKWLAFYWPKDYYSLEKHVGLAQMYLADERLKLLHQPAKRDQVLHDATVMPNGKNPKKPVTDFPKLKSIMLA